MMDSDGGSLSLHGDFVQGLGPVTVVTSFGLRRIFPVFQNLVIGEIVMETWKNGSGLAF
jgi:hypothetical protein